MVWQDDCFDIQRVYVDKISQIWDILDMEKQKPIEWVGKSLDDLRSFPEPIKDEVGFALHLAQEGTKHKSAKPMKGKGLDGVFEIVSPYMTDTYRTVYAIKISNTVYVLHAFQKKSKSGIKTPKSEIDKIKSRLKAAKKHAGVEK